MGVSQDGRFKSRRIVSERRPLCESDSPKLSLTYQACASRNNGAFVMSRDVVIAGVGMIPFTKPGMGDAYPNMASIAARAALSDAGIGYELIEQAYVGYVYGDSTAGQRALYELGMTGIPIFNVNNNCSTGSTALYLAVQAQAKGAPE